MKQTTDKQAHAAPLTREEFWRRWEERKRKKQALVEDMKAYLTAKYKERTGREPEPNSFEVW